MKIIVLIYIIINIIYFLGLFDDARACEDNKLSVPVGDEEYYNDYNMSIIEFLLFPIAGITFYFIKAIILAVNKIIDIVC